MRRLFQAAFICTLAATAISIGHAQTRRISLPEGHDFTNPDRQVFAMSPDGTRFAYIAHATLFVKPVSEAQPVAVPGPLAGRGIANPVFSPDGQSIAYWAQDGSVLQRVSVTGGVPMTICKVVQAPFAMSWGADDQIVFGQGAQGILRVSAKGGTPQTIVTAKSGEAMHGPQVLPGGDAVLFTLGSGQNWDQAQIVVQSLKSGERKTIVQTGRDARYLPTGHLVYASAGRIMAVRFDTKSLQTIGQAAAIADNVQMAGATGTAQFSLASNGALAYVPVQSVPVQLGLVGLDGTRKMLGPVPDGTSAPRVSPDGRRVTFAAAGDIYVADLSNLAGARKVIAGGTFPLFSPDGQWLAFGSLGTKRDGGIEEIFLQRADGSGQAELLVKPGRAPEHWPEGDQGFSFITHRGKANDYDLWTYSIKEKEVTPLVVMNESAQLSSRFSPDMHWFAYMSSESGDWQVYVQPYPETGAKFQVTKQGGRLPLWSADGQQLFYEHDGQMFAVPVQFGVQPAFGTPSALPVTGFIQPLIRRNFDMTPDRKQFVMLFRPGPDIEVIANWLDRVRN